ncbi:MAG TPA: amidase [Chloroflexota bacterium]|jgi:amidase|nr:amidase [Chloroflexota bacterium]
MAGDTESSGAFPLQEMTIEALQQRLQQGAFTSEGLVDLYAQRIAACDRQGPELRAVLEINRDAFAVAAQRDRERREGKVRGPLHGIPILLKDNIDTADTLGTRAGSLALAGWSPPEDAFVVQQLRRAGAIVLGKLNMSEWANFRSTRSSSGWSAVGGQCRNPYALDRTPGGSSSGSGVAASANYAAACLGTETNGSIISPAAANGVIGIKPTVGLTSRRGVIPISASQDTVGPLARTVTDAAIVLSAIAGPDPRDPATVAGRGRASSDYTRFLSVDGARGARLGVPRERFFGYSEKVDAVVEDALRLLKDLGATLVDPANLPAVVTTNVRDAEMSVLLHEFKAGLNAYLAAVHPDLPVHCLADLIAFNEAHAADELPYFGQELLQMAHAVGGLDDPAYLTAREESRQSAGEHGLAAVLAEHQLDALVLPAADTPWKIDWINGDHGRGGGSGPAARAGYPAISVPAGFTFGLPVGLLLVGPAWSEPKLLQVAYAFEQASQARRAPQFLRSAFP